MICTDIQNRYSLWDNSPFGRYRQKSSARSREKETREPGQFYPSSLACPRKVPGTYSRNEPWVENGYLGYLRYGKTGNKDIQLDLKHSCKRSRIAMLRVLPPTNQTCLATNQFVAGCEMFLQKVESSSIFCNKIWLYLLRFSPTLGKLVLQQGMLILCMVWVPRKFIQLKVCIHATCNNLICCKTCHHHHHHHHQIFISSRYHIHKSYGGFPVSRKVKRILKLQLQ